MNIPTDITGKTVAIGDKIVYACPAGTGSSMLQLATIDEFVQIIPHPNGDPTMFVREDQLNKSRPTRFYAAGVVIKVKIKEVYHPWDPVTRQRAAESVTTYKGHSLTPQQSKSFARVEV